MPDTGHARHGDRSSGPVAALFCGSRDWSDIVAIERDIAALPPGSIVIEGGARGADRHARLLALERDLHVATVDARWQAFGKSAGYRRNAAMILLRPDVVYAYPLAGPGTRMMIDIARKAGVPVIVRRPRMSSDARSRTLDGDSNAAVEAPCEQCGNRPGATAEWGPWLCQGCSEMTARGDGGKGDLDA